MTRTRAFLFLVLLHLAGAAWSQSLIVDTVTRPPFSMVENGRDAGFSMDLVAALLKRMDQPFEVRRNDSFGEMLLNVSEGETDMAAANISVTSAREVHMDFSHPIFESGLQIMVKTEDLRQPSLVRALFSKDLAIAIGVAFLLLAGGGMLMWAVERRAQPYFDRPLKEAWFPSFWWALNLVVNGGFEERVPRTPVGRVFGVLLVISSLFIVSVFVAKITAVMTVEAISGSVNSVNDLYGKRVGTLSGSTAAGFLDRREVDFRGFGDLQELLAAFESDDVQIVVFDAPVLNYYTNHSGRGIGQTVGQVFLQESYGIALPQGSPLKEEVNRVLLELREDGTYDRIYAKWFGRIN